MTTHTMPHSLDATERSPDQESKGRLLIVDDEEMLMQALCETLGTEGYAVQGFNSPREALAAVRPGMFDLLLTDLMMPDFDGITLIAAARQIDPSLAAIVMTGHGTIDTAVAAMKNGALDYIVKPFRLKVIMPVLARAMDLQRLRRENAALQQREQLRTEELAAAYRDLESFSYSVSHDLRAPLVFMKGFANVLEEEYAEQLGEQGLHMVRVIRDGSHNMDAMIVGLLAFSHAGTQPLRRATVDMNALAHHAVSEARASSTGPEPHIDVAALPPALGDATVISHVWSNIIGNALKYSATRPEPRIRISGRIEGGEAIYQVQDNGVGFDMRYADKLFGAFRRLHSAEEFPGTGVGLAIAHRIIARHGGRISAEGVPDAGACITFALPGAAT